VVETQHLVIHQTLDQVEEAPAQQHLSGERPGGTGQGAREAGTPELDDAGQRDRPGQGVEETVPAHVELHRGERGRRAHGREHVVPLKDLVEDDAVGKPAQTNAEEQAGRPPAGAAVERVVSHGPT
jgi:hypothetical protein